MKRASTWNLLSVPSHPASTDPADALVPIAGAYERALWWDACTATPGWQVYDPADPSSATLTSIDPTKGLWIETDTLDALPAEGALPTSTSIQLCPGWNLVGFPAGQARHVRAALASIEGKYERVYAYDPSDAADPWAIYDVAVPAWANDLETLEPGRGYWILATEETTLEIVNEGAPPEVAFAVPADLAVVTAPTAVTGTVTSPLLDRWTLSHRLVGQTDWRELASERFPVGTGSEAGELATFDPTLLLNGLHQLRLEAVDFEGRSVEETISVTVDGDMKVGPFRISFVDLEIPLSGLAIQILRTYDSRDKRLGDFGVGWTLDIRQGYLQHNRPPGDGWRIVQPGGPFALPCSQVLESKSHRTVVRLSDHEIYRFRLRVKDPGTIIGGCIGRAEMEFVDGSAPGATLEILGNDEVLYQNEGDQLVDPDTFALFAARDVRLRTRDGRIFDLNLDAGVTRLEDRNGNTLEITEQGITHSSGVGVTFERNADGTLRRIVGPLGHASQYTIEDGDLVAFESRLGEVTTFRYGDEHDLLAILNARGHETTTAEFADDGRLRRLCDGAGVCTTLERDLDERTEIHVDGAGVRTIYRYDERGRVIERENALGHRDTFAYDRWGQRTLHRDPTGVERRWTYFDDGRIDTIVEPPPEGQGAEAWTTRFRYDEKSRISRIERPDGGVQAYQYL